MQRGLKPIGVEGLVGALCVLEAKRFVKLRWLSEYNVRDAVEPNIQIWLTWSRDEIAAVCKSLRSSPMTF